MIFVRVPSVVYTGLRGVQVGLLAGPVLAFVTDTVNVTTGFLVAASFVIGLPMLAVRPAGAS